MVSSTDPSNRTTQTALGLAALLFTASAYYAVSTAHPGAPGPSKIPPAKPPSDSAVGRMTYMTRPDDCEAPVAGSNLRPKIHAGVLFKLIDIAAGVAARRHSGLPCVTISVDSVVLLKPIFLGDLIHVSAGVNRAWGTSMEVGVRIVKESVDKNTEWRSGETEYVSHSYLTFVAINKKVPDLSFSQKALRFLGGSNSPGTLPKPVLAPIKPTSRLEARRHLLAGQRRNKRLEDAKHGKTREGVSVDIKRQVREEIKGLLASYEVDEHAPVSVNSLDERRRSEVLRTVELEVIVQAWAQDDKTVSVQNGMVEVKTPGDEPIQYPEAVVRATAKLLDVKVPGDADFNPLEYRLHGFTPTTWGGRDSTHSPEPRKLKIDRTKSFYVEPHLLPVAKTLTTTMHIVFPQHTNSHDIIFGGNTMSWSEEVAIMACRRIQISSNAKAISWKTVSMDGLEFNVQVPVGELMVFSAIVVRTYAHSLEVYVLAQAEDNQGKRRITNDVLFTLAYDETDKVDEDDPKGHIITRVVMPPDSALEEFAAAGAARRQQRLNLRQMLVRIYGS